MPKQESENIENRSKQREESRRATFDLLRNKPRAEKEIALSIPTGDGESQDVTMLFRAIGSSEYDRLLTKHPPTIEQKAENASYNINTFGPALLAHVCVEPEISGAEWKELWDSGDWNRGEILQLFFNAVELCNKGLDIPFFATD